MRQRATWLLLAALVLALPLAAQEWAGRQRVQGIVLNENGEPIPGATVTLTLGEEGPPPLQTDNKGRWTVLAEFEGYVPAESPLRIPTKERLEISLRPIPPELYADPNRALERLKKGNELLGEGKPAEARAEYEAALEDLTEDSRVQVLLPIARTYYLEDNSARR
jgi:hypothetical protein